MRVPGDSVRSLFLFKSNRNDRTRKVQARLAEAVALYACKPRVSTVCTIRWKVSLKKLRGLFAFIYELGTSRLRTRSAESVFKMPISPDFTDSIGESSLSHDYLSRQRPHLQETEIPSGTRCIQTRGLLAAVAEFTSNTKIAFMWELIKLEFSWNSFGLKMSTGTLKILRFSR